MSKKKSPGVLSKEQVFFGQPSTPKKSQSYGHCPCRGGTENQHQWTNLEPMSVAFKPDGLDSSPSLKVWSHESVKDAAKFY